MAEKSNTEEFICKARIKHGDLYDYSKSIYVTAYQKLIIICAKHGEFEQTPHGHLGGKGCTQCGIEKRTSKLRSNTQNFINNAKLIHGNFYNYSKSIYTNGHERIIIICPIHGEFEQIASGHLQGSGCRKCADVKSAAGRRGNTEDFIRRAILIHGDSYNYSQSAYFDCYTKIKIICPKHGEFLQNPMDHLRGKGCNQCGFEGVMWGSEDWIRAAEKSKKFDSFKVYIIKCWSEETGEEFYKVGRTFCKINQRFLKSNMPYKWDLIFVISLGAKEAFNLEKQLKKENKLFKYIPTIGFNGKTECFSSIDLSEINMETLCY